MRSHYRLSLSLLNADPAASAVRFEWEAQSAVEGTAARRFARATVAFTCSLVCCACLFVRTAYLSPFLGRLSAVLSASIDSQVLHYTPLVPPQSGSASGAGSGSGSGTGITFDAASASYVITPHALSRFVGASQWNVGRHLHFAIFSSPSFLLLQSLIAVCVLPNVVSPLASSSIELMLYLPSAAHCPLRIRTPKSKSGLSVAWLIVVPRFFRVMCDVM